MDSPRDQEPPFKKVVASYHRARESGEVFGTFYRLFLSKSPEIPPMFARTEFPHQILMLRESLLEMLMFSQSESGGAAIEHLAERHRSLNVKPRHYELWLDALCEALAQHDPEFSVELEQMWRHAMQKRIKLMSEPAARTGMSHGVQQFGQWSTHEKLKGIAVSQANRNANISH